MNCKNCGSPLAPGSNKCNVCGMEVEQPIVSDNNSTNQNVAVPNLGLDQNNQQPVNNGVTAPNMAVQSDSLQQSQVSQTNNTDAQVQTPVTPVESSIPSSNPFMNNQNLDSQSANPVSSVSENEDLNQTSIVLGEQQNVEANLVGNNDVPNGLDVNQTPQQTISSEPMQTATAQAPSEVSTTDNQGQMLSENPQTVDNTPMTQVPLEEVQQQPKKKGKIGIIIVIVLILAIVGFFVFQYISLTNTANKVKNNNANNNQQIPSNKEDDTSKENENNQGENNNNPNNDNNVLTAAKFFEFYKNYMMQNGLYYAPNTEYFDLTTVKYLGYYENAPETKYYVVNGSFKCLDDSYQCVYMEQVIEEPGDFKYDYAGGVSLVEENGSLKVISGLQPTFESQVKYDPETAAGFVLVDEVLS